MDLAERAALQVVLDHLSHEYIKPDIAFVLRRLNSLAHGVSDEFPILPPGCIVRVAGVFVAGRSTCG